MSTSISCIYKSDPSAGDIPLNVHYRTTFSGQGPRPTVLVFHAGGYTVLGGFIVPQTQIDALLDLGFVVVVPEFRLCPQVSVAEGPATDARECLAWTRSKLPELLKSSTGVETDPKRIAAMGHSAGGNLALLLGGEVEPPSVIVSIYPGLYMERGFWHKPLAAFASVPDTPQGFRDQVFEGPVPLISGSMMTREGKPDLTNPRSAWMIQALKEGNQMSKVIKDSDYSKVDATYHFKRGFPPTTIIHGTRDRFAPFEYATEASEKLKSFGVPTELIAVPEQDHMFDLPISRDHELFGYVQQGFEFMHKHV